VQERGDVASHKRSCLPYRPPTTVWDTPPSDLA
jgi:hypothetical protein